MAIVTATPPDSETEVIVSVDENVSVTADETPAVADEADPTPDAAVKEGGLATAEAAGDAALESAEETAGQHSEDKAKETAEEETAAEDANSEAPSVQKLYRHDCVYGSCPTRWSRFAVSQEEQDALEAEVCSNPIVQRHVYSSDKGWETESFAINCPDMRSFLSETLANYQDLDPDLEGWSFLPPYKALVHRWDRLQTLHQELKDSDGQDAKKSAVNQLIEFLEPILAPSIEDLTATRESGKVRYDMLWQIFPPGETVLTKLWGVNTVGRVVRYHKSSSRKCWLITIEYIDWDGEKCGYQRTDVRIPWYAGYTRVTSLPGYPLSYADNADELKETMAARGRRFQELRGYHFLNYDGVKVLMGDEWEEEPVTGRVIIDTFAYYRSNNIVKPGLRALDGSDDAAEDNDDNDGNDEQVEEDESNEFPGETIPTTGQTKPSGRVEDLTELSEEQCLLTTPWLIGFDLKRKQWGRFLIDSLDNIAWNDKAFENLVLPGGEKELAWEFVESKARAEEAIDDFVPEKGRGIIILMFGPPGVGKTYTAEAVAEKARVPLYLVSAGMLGTSPETVEHALTHALELCRLWNAMLLLDEADVFLGARLDDSLMRNELVSIFLTKLEYYQGILFLTTNRFSRIDHAFQSRVDLFLPYHDLDPAARKQVWHNFFEHFGPDKFDVSPADVDRLADLPLNGREIKNLLKSAQLLNSRAPAGTKVSAERLFMLADKRVAALKMLGEYNEKV